MNIRYYKLFGIILLLIFLPMFSAIVGCLPTNETIFKIEATGAVVRNCEDERATIKSYSPTMKLLIERIEGNKPLNIFIENVPSEYIEAEIVAPFEEASKAIVSIEKLSNTEIILNIEGGTGTQEIHLGLNEEFYKSSLTFAVLGDSQGNNDALTHIIKAINEAEISFLVHLGDMVPSGKEQEYQDFFEVMKELEVPFYTVPGNHDVRGNGLEVYEQNLAPAYYSFNIKDYNLVFLDTSKLGLDQVQRDWLETELGNDKDVLIFLHVPLYDPRGKEHAFLDKTEADSLLELIKEAPSNVRGVFSGHIHMFSHEIVEDISFITSGGGGAHLYAAADEGGFHHYTIIQVDDESLQVLPISMEIPTRSLGIVVSGKHGDMEFSPEELLEIAVVEKEAAAQNIHGNYRNKGMYKGVPVRDLLRDVGGMEQGDLLVVHSWDGYSHKFSYENVFPEEVGWEQIQGEMVLAIEYNGEPVPNWDEGYRIVFLPEDGVFDNEDYRKISMPGLGWHLYPSAGSSWVKNINRLEVVSAKN